MLMISVLKINLKTSVLTIFYNTYIVHYMGLPQIMKQTSFFWWSSSIGWLLFVQNDISETNLCFIPEKPQVYSKGWQPSIKLGWFVIICSRKTTCLRNMSLQITMSCSFQTRKQNACLRLQFKSLYKYIISNNAGKYNIFSIH